MLAKFLDWVKVNKHNTNNTDRIQVPERSINSSSRRSKYLLHVFRSTLSNAKVPVQQDWFPYHKQCRTYQQS